MNVAYIIDRNSGNVTIYVGAKPYTINKDHCNYEVVLECLREKVYDDLEKLLDIPSAIATASQGKVLVEDGRVYYNGMEIHNVLVDRILDFMKGGFPFDSLVLFLENLLQNPIEETIQELYLFLESGNLPITDDGCFLAYKKVNDNLQSYHPNPDGTYLQHVIGESVEMPRDQVDTDRDRTCSAGLHFCSLSYLPKYSGGRGKVVILKINPKDVCAIPSDYNNTKGRAWRYEVMAEYDHSERETEDAFEDSYVDTAEGTEGVREAMTHVQATSPSRDSRGRFISRQAIQATTTTLGIKPDGKKFHNVRGNNGRFTKRV